MVHTEALVAPVRMVQHERVPVLLVEVNMAREVVLVVEVNTARVRLLVVKLSTVQDTNTEPASTVNITAVVGTGNTAPTLSRVGPTASKLRKAYLEVLAAKVSRVHKRVPASSRKRSKQEA